MNSKAKLICVLKQIELKKLLNDSSLGSYAKIHAEHLYVNYYDYYYDLINKKTLIKYLDFVEKDAREMYENILKEYGDLGPSSWSNADYWVKSKMKTKINEKNVTPTLLFKIIFNAI